MSQFFVSGEQSLAFQLQHQSFQWTPRTDFLQDGLVGHPCSPRDSQESSPTPQFRSMNSSVLSFLYSPTLTSIWCEGSTHHKGDGSTVWCCEEQYCIEIWNVRSMNQGKLEVVKQEMARVNSDILEISKLKQTGMGEFNSDDRYIYYCGQESLRRNGVATIGNKRLQNAVLGCSLKNDRMICSFPRQTIQYHSNPSLCPNQ